mgnify:CR=1 FL=1
MSSESPKKNPTLHDVAKAAGVSKMTVSRVLRGTGRISEPTSKKVEAAVAQLGYRPNPMVQTLMAGVRKKRVENNANIAWVQNYKPEEPLPDSLKELEVGGQERAKELGYGMTRLNIDSDDAKPEAVTRNLRARGVRGAIICPMRDTNRPLVFPWEHFAIATIGRSLRRPAIHYTMSHHYHIMQKVLDEVTTRGYSRIGLLIGSPEWETRADYATTMVFQHHCSQMGLDPCVAYQTCGNWEAQDYCAWYQSFQPDAIIGDYGHRYHTLIEAGLPMSQIGYATLSWKAKDPQCAGVKQPFAGLGASAVDLVVAQIHRNERGIPISPKAILMEGEWVEGSSLPAAATH